MLRPTLRCLSALIAISTLACAGPTAPVAARPQVTVPIPSASFDDITPPTDTTCRSGYINGQGRTC